MPPDRKWSFETGYDGMVGDAIFDEKTGKWHYSDEKQLHTHLDEGKALKRTRGAIQELGRRLRDHAVDATAAAKVREECRDGVWSGPTSGKAAGHVQANLVILPSKYKNHFERFCALNPQACALLETIDSTTTTDPNGHRRLKLISAVVTPGADILTDAPKYTVYNGHDKVEVLRADTSVPEDVEGLTGFVFGCSFSWEDKLADAGAPPRHMVQGKNVSMYRTNIPNKVAGPFGGVLVVTMRPYRLDQIPQVIQITSQYPLAHGRPVHIGDGRAIGVDVSQPPHYGDAVEVHDDEVSMNNFRAERFLSF
ncbi:hypothetical protein FOZ61_010087 [Perkinsus olseni]|uniref:Uncharacterized protein n=1 Tax=Perkinsus olseni TaxID=32597 RepID=A0A7J6M3S8_PEROL|nr:hypothetical protein FOZ61_010087 [Perkinsus olseni]